MAFPPFSSFVLYLFERDQFSPTPYFRANKHHVINIMYDVTKLFEVGGALRQANKAGQDGECVVVRLYLPINAVPLVPQFQYVLLFSRQGKVRLHKWYHAFTQKEKKKIQRELVTTILGRRSKMCNVLEYRDTKVVYKRYEKEEVVGFYRSQSNCTWL